MVVSPTSTHYIRPRVSRHINDNYLVNAPSSRWLTQSKQTVKFVDLYQLQRTGPDNLHNQESVTLYQCHHHFQTRPNLTRSPTIISCYVNPHRNLYLIEALHQLMNKNTVELVKNQESPRFGAGPQTSFQLRRLPVRPERGQGHTHPRVLADPYNKDPRIIDRSGLEGEWSLLPEVFQAIFNRWH